MSGHDQDTPRDAEAEAFDWMIRLREAPDDAGLAQAHALWLAEDPGNARAWEAASGTWDMLGALRPARSQALAPANHPVAGPVSGRERSRAAIPRRRVRPLALAAMAAVLLVLFVLPQSWRLSGADYVTEVAETEQIDLPDGSRITLGADSALSVDFGATRREVRLLGGAAFFQVAHDPDRPFTVRSGPLRATALGTAFEVAEAAGVDEVSVAEGRVQVSGAEAPPASPLAPGDWLRRGADGAVLRGAGDPAAVANWRSGMLFVEDRSLSEVAALLERYSGGRILLLRADPERHVTGIYDLARPDAALETLAASLALKVRRIGPLRILSSP